jgi:hypothetical protein
MSAIIRWILQRLAFGEQAFARRVAIGASGTERDCPLDYDASLLLSRQGAETAIGASGTERNHPLDITTPRSW